MRAAAQRTDTPGADAVQKLESPLAVSGRVKGHTGRQDELEFSAGSR